MFKQGNCMLKKLRRKKRGDYSTGLYWTLTRLYTQARTLFRRVSVCFKIFCNVVCDLYFSQAFDVLVWVFPYFILIFGFTNNRMVHDDIGIVSFRWGDLFHRIQKCFILQMITHKFGMLKRVENVIPMFLRPAVRNDIAYFVHHMIN